MWSAIKDVLTSSNALIILIFLAFSIIVIYMLSRIGLLQVHTRSIQLGTVAYEREIIRQQIEWTKLHYEGLENSITKPKGYDHWRGKYIAERMIDEMVDWIIYNHISTSEAYIQVKQDKMMNILKKYAIKEEFLSDEFEEFIRNDTKESIKKLVQIRKLYLKS